MIMSCMFPSSVFARGRVNVDDRNSGGGDESRKVDLSKSGKEGAVRCLFFPHTKPPSLKLLLP